MLHACRPGDGELDEGRCMKNADNEAGIDARLGAEHEQFRRAKAFVIHKDTFIQIGAELAKKDVARPEHMLRASKVGRAAFTCPREAPRGHMLQANIDIVGPIDLPDRLGP